jgi:hypothetical protein
MRPHRFAFVLPFVCALLAAAPAAQSVQLADGSVLLADVDPESVSGEGLRVRRLDNGGVLDLRWEHLSAASAHAWKKKFDLAGDAQDELTVRADEVEYEVAGSRQRLLGRIVEQTPEHIVLQARGVNYKIQRVNLLAARQVDAPVMQVLTKDQFYQEQRDLLQPGDEADRHVLLAESLLRVKDYDHAGEHLTKAKELGNSKNPQQIDGLLAKLARYKEAAKELKLLEEIEAARSRGGLGDFEKGVKLVAQFEKDFPQSRLRSDFEAEKRRFEAARDRFLIGQVAEKWRDGIRVVAEKLVAENPTLSAARDYAQGKMTDDIVARVAGQLRLDAEEVKALWAKRKNTQIGKRTALFVYSVGSWVLGKDNILKGTETGKAIEKQKGAQQPQQPDANMDKLLKELKKALERRRAAVQSQGEAKEQTEDDWWNDAERNEKIGWLRAFYAEYGGQLEVTFATVSPCISCYGEGTVPEIGPDGKMVHNKCFLCQSTKFTRSFKAF